MSNNFWQAIANTPWWTYLIVLYLAHIGYKATKPNIIPVKNFFLFPLLFFILTIIGMTTLIHLTFANTLTWATMFVLGAGIGWLHFRYLNIKAIKGEKKIRLPGSWGLIFIMITFFASKYYFGFGVNFDAAINPEAIKSSQFHLMLMTTYGFITGLFLGRIAYTVRVLKLGPFVTA